MSSTFPPRWQDLLARYLQRPHDVPVQGEVELYQAQPALGLDLGMAWEDALLPGTSLGETSSETDPYPEAWQQTRAYQWAAPFPCCVGLAPQFLQQIHGLMQNAQEFFRSPLEVTATVSSAGETHNLPWLQRLTVARATGDLDTVESLLDHPDGHANLMIENERAAQAWLRGDRVTAARLWNQLPDSQPPIAFNQALTALAQGDTARGREKLAKAAAGFPETTGWRHLADLYRVALGD